MVAGWKCLAGSVACVLIVAAAGCGGGDRPAVSTSTTKAKVSGVVRLKGAPVGGGRIYFDPSNVERKMAGEVGADIDKDGKYTVETLVGGNRVRVDVTSPPAQELTQFEVKEGENVFNYDVPTRD